MSALFYPCFSRGFVNSSMWQNTTANFRAKSKPDFQLCSPLLRPPMKKRGSRSALGNPQHRRVIMSQGRSLAVIGKHLTVSKNKRHLSNFTKLRRLTSILLLFIKKTIRVLFSSHAPTPPFLFLFFVTNNPNNSFLIVELLLKYSRIQRMTSESDVLESSQTEIMLSDLQGKVQGD